MLLPRLKRPVIFLLLCLAPRAVHAQARLYVLNSCDESVSVINPANNSVTATVVLYGNVGENNDSMVVDPITGRLYVINSDQVHVYSGASLSQVGVITAGPTPWALALNASAQRLYITNYEGSVTVVNTANNAVITTIPVDPQPRSIAVDPDASRAYTTNFSSDTISVIDTSNNTLIATLRDPAEGFDATIVKQVVTLLLRNEYKRRQSPPGIKITRCAFGRDRRYPITSGFQPNKSSA